MEFRFRVLNLWPSSQRRCREYRYSPWILIVGISILQLCRSGTNNLKPLARYSFPKPSATTISISARLQNTTADSIAIPLSLPITNSSDIISSTYGPSLLSYEISRVLHIPSQSKIVIEFNQSKEARKCLNPYVMGRLSGPYIALIEWETNDDDTDTIRIVDQVIGYYRVPESGRYFLEIIGILCNDLTYDTNYQRVCLEDPTRHRITHPKAFIGVMSIQEPSHASEDFGYWKWSVPSSSSTTSAQGGINSLDATVPLLTRYRPHGCSLADALTTENCERPMSRDRFNPYQFEFQYRERRVENNFEEATLSLIDRQQQEQQQQPIVVCFVGLSHAREMAKAVGSWLQHWDIRTVSVKNIDANFPWQVTETFIDSIIESCYKTVLAVGQWPAGRKPPGGKYRGMPPTLFPDYQKEVQDMLTRLKLSDLTNYYLRSIHYNSLGDIKTTCPPQDWRSPPVIDRYNAIIKNLSVTMGVPYVDTNPIIGPMWDSAEDFCHYRTTGKVAEMEALYVLHQLFA